jgi:LysM repeat protein
MAKANQGPSTEEIKEELRKYKAERSKCAKQHSLYSLAFKEFIGKIRNYRNISMETRKGYDAIIESLENGLHAARAMDPKHRLYRKAAIGLACVASLYLGTQLAEKPSVMPVSPPTSHSSTKAAHYSEHQKEYRPKPIRLSAPIVQQASSQAYFWYFPVRGDTLSKIAGEVTGDSSNWSKIKSYSNLQNDLIEVNQPLKIPGSLEGTTETYTAVR